MVLARKQFLEQRGSENIITVDLAGFVKLATVIVTPSRPNIGAVIFLSGVP
jgi:hypothetical protein